MSTPEAAGPRLARQSAVSNDPAPDQRARGGFAILAGLLLVAVLIVNLQAVVDLTRDRLDLVVIVAEAPAISIGSPVWVEGVESGRVTRIAFLPAGDSVEVALSVRVEGEARAVLRRDSDVRAVRQRFIGEPLVSLRAGTPGAPMVRDGDTLRSRSHLDPMAILERAREVPDSLAALMEQVRRVGDMAAAREPELEALGRRVDAASAAASALSDQLDSGSLRPLLAADGVGRQVGALRDRIAELSDAVSVAMERYTGAEGDGSELTASLAGLSERVAGLNADLEALAADLRESDGMLGRMQRDSALAVAIRGVQAQVDSVRAEAASIVLRMLLP